MEQGKDWVKALNIEPNQVALWSSQLSADQDLLFWCLEKGHVPIQEYLDWAQDHYQLCFLESTFFNEQFNSNFYRQIQSVANWGPHMLPITEWDGVVFIACVQPPSRIQWSFPVKYVLAHPRALAQAWKTLEQGHNSTTTGMSPVPSEKQSHSDHEQPNVTNFVLVTPDNMAETQNSISPEPTQVDLEDLTKDQEVEPTQVQTAEATQVHLKNFPGTQTQTEVANSTDVPEGLNFNFEAPPADMPIADEEVSESKGDMPEGLNLNLEEVSSGSDENLLDFTSIRVETPASSQEGINQNPVEIDAIEPTSSPDPETTVDHDLDVGTSLIQVDRGAKQDVGSTQTNNEVLAWYFNQLRQHFHGTIILRYQNGKLEPWKWDEAWTPKNESAMQPVDLDSPSIFRIVERTDLPYHGYVVSSDVNDRFFKIWGFNNLPSHVTAFPLIVNDQKVGMTVTIGDEASYNPTALQFAERITAKLSSRLSTSDLKAA